MVSDYQMKFLHHISREPIRFLVVGGQARRRLKGPPNFDLDLWVDYGPSSHGAILKLLLDWIRLYPGHAPYGAIDFLPTQLGERCDQKFPDIDEDCPYDDGTASGGTVWASNGVDIIMGGRTDPPFADCFDRSIEVDLEEIVVRCLSEADMHRLPRLVPKIYRRDTGRSEG